MKFAILLTFILFIGCASAFQIGVYPAEINISSNVGERNCFGVGILTSTNVSIKIGDRWAGEGIKPNGLKDYNLTASDLGLEVYHADNIYVDKEKSLEICILAHRGGNFRGGLLFSSGAYGVGNLINIHAENRNMLELTGAFIGTNFKGNALLVVIISVGLLGILVLVFILIKIRKN